MILRRILILTTLDITTSIQGIKGVQLESLIKAGWIMEQKMQSPKAPSKKKAPKF